MRILITCMLLTIVYCSPVQAQDGTYIDFKSCYRWSEATFNLQGQKEWITAATEEAIDKVNASWQPKLSLNAQATYQSDVVGLPIESPLFNIPALDKDQYRATLDIQQLLYDGGAMRQQKTLQQLQSGLQAAQTDVSFYSMYRQIDQLYCAVLLARNNQLLILSSLKDLEARKQQLETAFQNGAATQNALHQLEAEMLKVEQMLQDARYAEQGAIDALAVLTGKPLTTTVQLLIPEVELPASTDNLRPETALFERQLALTEAQREFASSLNLPTISLFGQGGYGRPGLNLLLNDFEAFYIGGIRLSYVLWSGGGKTHEAAVYQIQQKQLRQQQENFLLSTRSQASRQLSEIRQLEAAIAQDAAIIDLRNQILTTSALTLENGTGTAADYTRDSNAALQAKLTRELHTIQLMLAQLDYLSTIGKTK